MIRACTMHAHTHVYMYVQAYVHADVYVCERARVLCGCVRLVCAGVCACVRVWVCVCERVRVWLRLRARATVTDLARAVLLLLERRLDEPWQEAAVVDQRQPLRQVPVHVRQVARVQARLAAEKHHDGLGLLQPRNCDTVSSRRAHR
jgi:hypothetical protein